MLGLDVAHGELSEWDAVLDKRIPVRLHSRVWSDGSSSNSGPLGDSGDTTVSQKSLPMEMSRRFVKPSASVYKAGGCSLVVDEHARQGDSHCSVLILVGHRPVISASGSGIK